MDLRDVSYVDTSIIAALVLPAKAMMKRGTRLKVLVTEGAYPQYVLNTVGFKDLMDIVAEAGSEGEGNE